MTITFHPKNTAIAHRAMTTLIPRMRHEGGKAMKPLFDLDAWKHSEEAQWDPIAETATSPDDEELDTLFHIDSECDCVPVELSEQFHQEMSQRTKEANSESVGSLTTFNQSELRDGHCSDKTSTKESVDLSSVDSEEFEKVKLDENITNCATSESQIEQVNQPDDTAVSRGSSVRFNLKPKIWNVPTHGEGRPHPSKEKQKQASGNFSPATNINDNNANHQCHNVHQTFDQASNQSPPMQEAGKK